MKKLVVIAVVVVAVGGGFLAVKRNGWMRRSTTKHAAPAARSTPAPEVDTNPGRTTSAGLPKPVSAFIESHCLDCHDDSSSKGGLNFESLTAALDDAAVEAKWTLVFDRVQRGEMPPKKSSQPPPQESAAFAKGLGALLEQHDTQRRANVGRVVWRRMNRVEYENTIHDLLAIDTPLADLLPEDGAAHGFDNVSEGLRLSAAQIEAYLAAADMALDAAVQMKARPEAKKMRMAMLESPTVQSALTTVHHSLRNDGTKNEKVLRALPDAVVMFVNQANKAMVFRAPSEEPGIYKVRISAYGFQTRGGPTVVAKLMLSDFSKYRVAAAFDAPEGQPRVMETTVRLNKDEIFTIAASGCGIAADGSEVRNVGGDDFAGSGLAIQWVEVEGPMIEEWPPASVSRVFGPLAAQPVAEGNQEARAFEIGAAPSAENIDRAVADFARRAFRRPLQAGESEVYARLAHEALAQGEGLEDSLRRAFKAILASPEFLFLREAAGRIDQYALASRLSYFFWSSMPDEELMAAASAGTLQESATLRAQTERLLSHPKAAAFVRNFCGQWLKIRDIDATMPDKRLYPEFDDLLRAAMLGETEAFFAEVVRGNMSVATLVESDFAMLNRRLAEHYGIKGVVGEDIRKVALPVGSHRGGLLTQASILKVTANGSLSSPVVRGAWVMKRILGREPQPPPANAGNIEPDTRGATTIRDQLAKHRRSESCAGCHKYIDPAGFALESYDVIGGWRESYRTRKGKSVMDPFTGKKLKYGLGLPVDPSGELADGRKFSDLDQFKKLLLEQQEAIARNLLNNFVAYGTGAGATFSDRGEVEKILLSVKADSYPVRDMIHALVQSPLFLNK